jgi:E3 ubiquitin-protein ligase SHPRH
MQGQGRGERRLVLGRQLMTMKEALDKMKNDHAQEYLIESRKQVSRDRSHQKHKH